MVGMGDRKILFEMLAKDKLSGTAPHYVDIAKALDESTIKQ